MYILEIYEPDSMEVLDVFKSDTPFLAISKGDLINQSFLNGGTYGNSEILMVTSVEHILWNVTNPDRVKHKICAYTRRVANTAELRAEE